MPKPEQFPTKEQIAKRAHELYLERGRSQGGDMKDWLQAELQLMMESYLERASRAPANRPKMTSAEINPPLLPEDQQESKLTTEVEKGS